MMYALGATLILVSFVAVLQTLGETRLAFIFPVISVLAVLAFLARCMFTAPVHH
jgi:hypothetical protein